MSGNSSPARWLRPSLTSLNSGRLAARKGFLFSDIGEVELKGFEEAVRLYEVRWREES